MDMNLETLQPILKRGRDVWDQINMPKAEFEQRVKTIRREMKKQGINVLLLCGSSVNDYGNQCYVSNFVTKLTAGALVIVPQKGDLTLLFEGSARELKIGKRVTWIDDTRSSLGGVFGSTGSLAGDCLNYLQEKRLTSSKVGLVGVRELMPYRELQRLLEGMKRCEIVDAGHIIRDMRMIKSERECDQIRRASRIVSNTFGVITGMVLRNMDERSMEAKIDWAVRLQGAEDVRILLARPRDTAWSLSPAEKRAIAPGDVVIVYLAASFERYWAEGIRTFVAENASFVEAKPESLEKLYQEITATMKPGNSIAQCYEGASHKIEQAGSGYMSQYGLGNGIGLSLSESPAISREGAGRFAKSTCFALRLAVRDTTYGSVMFGNTLLVGKSGAEVLT